MLKFLIIQLSDNSVSVCHYPQNNGKDCKTISAETLNKAIFWAMQQDLSIQFLYPDNSLPKDVEDAVATVCSNKIASISVNHQRKDIDAFVIDDLSNIAENDINPDGTYSVKASLKELVANHDKMALLLRVAKRVNVILNDIDKFSEADFVVYSDYLDSLADVVKGEYENGHPIQLNLLTDCLYLDKMNNCNAGYESVTLAPDGKFYVCPAFYIDGSDSIGDLEIGLDIKNPQLYKLDHAPICRNCDAYQCHRCIWLNKRTTLEVNTPSHQQCVISHLERNASRKLLEEIRKIGDFLPEKEIKEIDYLDPFEKYFNS